MPAYRRSRKKALAKRATTTKADIELFLDAKHIISDARGMNRLPRETRIQILSMLCEGASMRSISRAADVSINTVDKLLRDAGEACVVFHDERVQNVKSRRVQCDEIWSFIYAKQKNVKAAKAPAPRAGDVWTWTAIDADNKLIVSWLVGGRDSAYALALMDDLRSRLVNRVQLTMDGPQRVSGSGQARLRRRYHYQRLHLTPRSAAPIRRARSR
jgi:DNA-binding transcriptional ArsR family regulator